MPHIQQLSSHVADLIAAGEVVERPASVVKELMENAIDAGASAVTVEIANGGMSLIRITDNGCGIDKGELATAFLRHATSKLRTERDLEAIGTLGFRGEALAAIAAVSRIEVMTCAAGAPMGAALSIQGGEPGEIEDAGCPPGTTMVVRELFFNTPARLKFMKKDAAEGAAVFAVVQREALAHPEVAVTFLRDGKQELTTPGDGQMKSTVYSVMGRDLALGFTPVSSVGEEMSVTGFVSRPTCCRGTRGCQHFFVNGRYVKSPLMMTAVERAYDNQKMVGKFPGCVLHLTMKLNAVDVNVHPTKTEVKFGSERKVFDMVYYAVKSALEGDNDRPAVLPETRSAPHPAGQSAETKASTTGGTGSPIQTAFSTMSAATYRAGQEKTPVTLHDFIRPAAQPMPVAAPAIPPNPKPAARIEIVPLVTPSPANVQNAEWSKPTDVPPCSQTSTEESLQVPEPTPAKHTAPEEIPWRMVGEVLCTYIVVEQGDTVLLIDKHAAHERMNFDRMKAQDYTPMVQVLLVPVTFTPPPDEGAALLAHLPLLAEFGFDVEGFGRGALIVRQAPFDVPEGEIEATLTALGEQLLLTGKADPAAQRDGLLHTMACKAAIKGGWKNDEAELLNVAQAVMTGSVKYCPHGRPVAIELTNAQLEKRFGRA